MTQIEYSPADLAADVAPLAELLAYNAATKRDISKAAIIPIYSRGVLVGYGESVDIAKAADRSGSLVNMDAYEKLAGDNSCFDSLGIFTDIADMQRADVEKSAEIEPEKLSEDAWLFESCFPPVLGVC